MIINKLIRTPSDKYESNYARKLREEQVEKIQELEEEIQELKKEIQELKTASKTTTEAKTLKGMNGKKTKILQTSQIARIKELHKENKSLREIGREVGVGKDTVSKVVKGTY